MIRIKSTVFSQVTRRVSLVTALVFLFLLILNPCSLTPNSNPDLTKYVNTFIGTGGHGHTFPGASMPFGFVQLSPDTRLEGWDGCGGYHYSDSVIYGFSHTHLSGTGVPDYCDILFMPVTGEVNLKNYGYASPFSHTKESSSPGYYKVYLSAPRITVELTCTQRAGFHKYTFPNKGARNIVIDLKHRDEVIESNIYFVGDREVRGYRYSKYWARDQRVYFVARFSKPFNKRLVSQNDAAPLETIEAVGNNLKAYLGFDKDDDEAILVKVGLSGVSIDGAVKNLDAEIPGWDFDKVKNNAGNEWNKELSKIQVEGGTINQKIIFYTALYHAMLNPNIYTDVDGQYRGRDMEIHKAEGFTNYTLFSLWDTYRAEHPLLTIIDQKRTNDFINTFLVQYKYGKLLPVWELSANETFCMIGYHAVPVIADAYMKGIRGYDAAYALEAMLASAGSDKFGLPAYVKYGLVPQDMEHESVSKTLEYAYDDWCIAQMSKELGDLTQFYRFNERAQYYKNVFDDSTGFMRARVNGGWYTPFDPAEVNNNYTEANSWQYSFYAPQDAAGFIKLHGGKDKLSAKLDELFSTDSRMSGRDQSDITGLIGQYAHGNEPSHHLAYWYDYLNQPWKTQALAHKIMTEFYKNDPDGLIGNEDCGQMSAWFVLSAMGFYSFCPGQTQYAVGTPLFDKVTINLENGKVFVINAENRTDKNYYIQSASLNKQPYAKCYITHEDIMNGGEIVFNMGGEPNKNWGSRNEDVPVTSISEYPIVSVPLIISESRSFSKPQTIVMKSVNADDKIYYTTDGSDPDFTSTLYIKPFEINESVTIKAVAYNSNLANSKITFANFVKVPEGRSVILKSVYSPQYTAGGPDGLIDLIRGTRNWRLGNWQGYQGQDFEVVVDLGNIQLINKISAGFIQDVGAWIVFPTVIEFEVSEDGINYTSAAIINNEIPPENKEVAIREYTSFLNTKARFVRVKAKSSGKLPAWHEGAGGDSWIFIDEISIGQ